MYKIIFTYLLILFPIIVFSQESENLTVQSPELFAPVSDNELIPLDTLISDTLLVTDTLDVDSTRKVKKAFIEAPIVYSAEDSIVVSFDGQKVFLYNNARVTYQDIELTAYYIELNLDIKEIYAEGILDSTETMIEKPIFTQGADEYESETMRYNFVSEKAFITKVVSEQGEGFILSDRTKKIGKETFITEKAKYTTCDADHPHFYMHLTKAKVISNKKIVTGPAYMVLEDFPIYFPMLPFGFFPNNPTYSSGILIPQYGEEQNRGFFLRDGGYYWAAGEYFDLAVRGEIYSKGSWGVQTHTNYRKRYKFSGGFDFRYNINVYGEQGLDTYTRTPQFAVTWNHSQDAKANPSRTFSASVNLSSSGYDRQNSYIGQTGGNNYLQTQKSSSVSYSKKFENTPFNMSINMRHSQNSRDTTLTLSLPEMTFSMAKIYPFRKKQRSGPVKFYEKFGINYTGNIRNTITAKEYDILKKSFPNDWKNGIQHGIPLAFPGFNLAKYINVSPSIGYNEKWYFKKYNYTYDPENLHYDEYGRASNVKKDTISGLSRVYDYNYSLSASTNIYGMFMPRNPDSRIKGIRHKLTPSASFSYRPDFGQARFGYWQEIQIDSTGKVGYFDVNAGGVYGGSPGRGASGAISMSLNNNLEMKVLDTKDTTSTNAAEKYKKVKLIDNLSLSSSYNLIADSMNLAPISIRARTTVAGVSINMGTLIDPYMLNDKYQRYNEYAWNVNRGLGRIGRIANANLSFGMNFNSKKKENKKEPAGSAPQDDEEELPVLPEIGTGYVDFNMPWTFGFDYSFSYSGPNSSAPKGRFSQTLGLRGNISLTDKWKVSMNTNFDIQAREFSYTSVNVNRDLHCWQMAFSFVPFGYMKSYSFTINAKASMLKDLQVQKRQSNYDRF
ncbi:MAG TPA: putative LPS assembly protein LptD [Draconibacterium sp.]|nr:putative LPS assembly protein LptD [Draconibacterium sp.]